MNCGLRPVELWLERGEPWVSNYYVFVPYIGDKEAYVPADSFGLYV